MKRILLFIGLPVALFTVYSLYVSTVFTHKSPVVNLNADKIFEQVNNYRAKNNLSPFIKDERLCDIAQVRAPEIQLEKNDPHAGFNKRFSNPDYDIGENNVTDAKTENDAVVQWISSKSHRDAMLSDLKYSCVACSKGDCVQIFSSFNRSLEKQS